ncbi:unnamed protein product [Darwinula stevensoni]|uniref:TFIIS central domain-containing protein n=1 Tax=Darwinula stevensoni TaxID=69355 RepID=A0A7R9A3H9_9CRUS|nr:unnamed protein product [Darwinula stevensoni]CAG0887940.1 unnamed protein product [Darwinula stevensoni]
MIAQMDIPSILHALRNTGKVNREILLILKMSLYSGVDFHGVLSLKMSCSLVVEHETPKDKNLIVLVDEESGEASLDPFSSGRLLAEEGKPDSLTLLHFTKNPAGKSPGGKLFFSVGVEGPLSLERTPKEHKKMSERNRPRQEHAMNLLEEGGLQLSADELQNLESILFSEEGRRVFGDAFPRGSSTAGPELLPMEQQLFIPPQLTAEEILTGIAMDHCYIAQSSRMLKVASVETNRAAPTPSEESPSDDLDSTLASMHAEEEPLKDSDQDGSSNDDISPMRRSQRQLERQEKEKADRIRAENRQMLEREKEAMLMATVGTKVDKDLIPPTDEGAPPIAIDEKRKSTSVKGKSEEIRDHAPKIDKKPREVKKVDHPEHPKRHTPDPPRPEESNIEGLTLIKLGAKPPPSHVADAIAKLKHQADNGTPLHKTKKEIRKQTKTLEPELFSKPDVLISEHGRRENDKKQETPCDILYSTSLDSGETKSSLDKLCKDEENQPDVRTEVTDEKSILLSSRSVSDDFPKLKESENQKIKESGLKRTDLSKTSVTNRIPANKTGVKQRLGPEEAMMNIKNSSMGEKVVNKGLMTSTAQEKAKEVSSGISRTEKSVSILKQRHSSASGKSEEHTKPSSGAPVSLNKMHKSLPQMKTANLETGGEKVKEKKKRKRRKKIRSVNTGASESSKAQSDMECEESDNPIPEDEDDDALKIVYDDEDEDEDDDDDDDDDDEEEEGAEDDSENDPNRLWCICQKPHDNRKMETRQKQDGAVNVHKTVKFSAEQKRVILLYHFRSGLKPQQAFEEMKKNIRDDAPGRTMVFKWFQRFEVGHFEVTDDPRSDGMVAAVAKFLGEEPSATTKRLADVFQVSKTSISSILHDQLDYSKKSARWVPCLLKLEKETRVNFCKMFLEDFEDGNSPNFQKPGKKMEKQGISWFCPNCKDKQSKGNDTPSKKHQSAPKPNPNIDKSLKLDKSVQKKRRMIGKQKSLMKKWKGGEKSDEKQLCVVSGCGKKVEQHSVFCSDECIEKHVAAVKEGKVASRAMSGKSNPLPVEARVTLFERSSGHIISGHEAPTIANLTSWLKQNPSYEVLITPSRLSAAKFYSNLGKTLGKGGLRPQALTMKHSDGQPQIGGSSAASGIKEEEIPDKKREHEKKEKSKKEREQSEKGKPDQDLKKKEPERSKKDHQEKKEPEKEQVKKDQDKAKKEKRAKEEEESTRKFVRTHLKTSLMTRLKDAPDMHMSEEKVDNLVKAVEEEMHSVFRSTSLKYKNKFRSLNFNLKDAKNQGLFRKVCLGEISPQALVQMSPEDLASKELAEWRERETKHQLEMIKKNELEWLQHGEIYLVKTHKGEVVIEGEDGLPSDKAKKGPEELKLPEQEPIVDLGLAPPGNGSSLLEDTTSHHGSHLYDMNCRICTGKEEPKILPSQKAKEMHKNLAKQKGRDRRKGKETGEGKRSQRPFPIQDRELEEIRRREEALEREIEEMKREYQEELKREEEEEKYLEKKIQNVLAEARQVEEASDDSPLSSSRSLHGHAGDDGTPASNDSPSSLPSVWKGFVHMADVVTCLTSAYQVSGFCDKLTTDLPDTLDIVGRIDPSTVWEYVAKMKKSGTKEITVLRFHPGNEGEESAYVLFYKYLWTRSRFGVVGNAHKMVKDFYIFPLASHAPVPQILLPLDGPGFEEKRPHLLLGVLIRHKRTRSTEEERRWLLKPVVSPSGAGGAVMHLDKHSGSFTPPLPMEDSQTPPGSPPTKKRAPYVPTMRKRKSESGLDLEVSYHPEVNQGSSRTIVPLLKMFFTSRNMMNGPNLAAVTQSHPLLHIKSRIPSPACHDSPRTKNDFAEAMSKNGATVGHISPACLLPRQRP